MDLDNTKKDSIVVIDDNVSNLNLLKAMLSEKGYMVRPFPSGKLALKSIEMNNPDIILLDINMPNMNGYEVCRYLKSKSKLKDIPVIFLSAYTGSEDKIKAFEAGGADYVSKPFNFEEVNARVNAHIRLRKYQQELEKKNRQLKKALSDLEEAVKKLEVISVTDYLTNILNKRGMRNKIKYEIMRSNRNGLNFSFVMCDIDLFKKVNDTYGHECGDYILAELAKILKQTIREIDEVARWGGEEFLLLLVNTNFKTALKAAERLRKIIENSSFAYKDYTIPVTMTFGVVQHDLADDVDMSIEKADEALYKGKETGRNCTMGYENNNIIKYEG